MSEIARQLTSVTFGLLSLHSRFLSLSLVHSVFPATLSPLPKHPHHLSSSSLKLFTPALLPLPLWRGGMKRVRWLEMGMGKRTGRFVRFGGLMRSERCCFGSKNLSCNMHPIDPLKRLPIQQKSWEDSSSSAIG